MKTQVIPFVWLLAFIVCVPSLFIFCSICDPFDRPFEQAAWRADSNHARFAMRNDLLRRHKLIGKPQADVIALLGPADSYNRSYLQYNMGAVGIDSDTRFTLYLRNGVVASCELLRRP
jgi:hypothetical protein